jgi:peptidoglycan/xylan/chitin deacetylase (PgdA/CDA1 family)
MMIRLPLSILSPAGSRGRLSILIFHRVLAQTDPLFPDVPTAFEFEQRMRWVSDWFNVLPLAQAVDMLFAGTIPSRALAITFDDGYADNEEIAAPILKRLGLSATFFVSTGFLDGGCMWNDRVIEAIRGCEDSHIDLRELGLQDFALDSRAARRHAIESILTDIKHHEQTKRQAIADAIIAAAGHPPLPRLMMRPDQVRAMRAHGMDIGAHTVTHPILTRLDGAAAHHEMRDGKRTLESLLGEPVVLFAYPNGVPLRDYSCSHVAMARDCGFKAAVSTAWGAGSMRSDRFQLPRFTPWDRTRMRYGLRLLANMRQREQAAP